MEETKKNGASEASKFKIKIDGTMYDVSQKMMTGRELLALASKTPIERYEISKREKGNIIKKVAYEVSISKMERVVKEEAPTNEEAGAV